MMHHSSRLFRLSASVAIGALLSSATLLPAVAQPVLPVPAAPPDQGQGDPPARVGRIASESGAVAFRTSADTQWSPATANYPVSSGNAFWTEPSARAELEISASRVDLSGQTEFEVTTLDAGGLQAVTEQGEFYLHLASLAPNEVWSVQTPRGTVRLAQAGRYDIVVGSTDQPTQLTVVEGAAVFDGPGVSLTVGPNQTATVTGTGPFQGSIGPEMRDAFLAARLGAERVPLPPPAPVAARLPYLPEITDLDGVGEWQQEPDYGEVWYPPVAPGWVPYQYGQWAYVAPWGWTWVDSAPWGFVPFHYGRWAHIGRRWGWIPGEAQASRREVYAPALVAFIGFSAAAAAARHGEVGWVPLGPGEAYHPWYHASPGYVRQINAGHVKDPAAINGPVAVNNFMNRGAATMIPAAVMFGSRSVHPEARLVSPQTLAAARPVVGEQPISPVVGTLGVTPAVAHRLNLETAAGTTPPRFVPGPAVRIQEPGSPNGARTLPHLVGPGGQAGTARPGPGAVPSPGPLPLVVPGTPPGAVPRVPENRRPEAPGFATPPAGPHPGAEFPRPPGTFPLPGPGGRPPGVPLPGEVRPTQPGVIAPRPPAGAEGVPGRPHEPMGQLPIIERPNHEAPALRQPPPIQPAPPHITAPEPPRPLPHITAPEPPRLPPPGTAPEPPRPLPHISAPEPPRPAPHFAPPEPPHPPPHFAAPEPPRAPPPRMEPPRPPPPPHVEPPHEAQPQRRPGQP